MKRKKRMQHSHYSSFNAVAPRNPPLAIWNPPLDFTFHLFLFALLQNDIKSRVAVLSWGRHSNNPHSSTKSWRRWARAVADMVPVCCRPSNSEPYVPCVDLVCPCKSVPMRGSAHGARPAR